MRPGFPYTDADFVRNRTIVTGDPVKYEGIAAAELLPGTLVTGPEGALVNAGATQAVVNRSYVLERGLTGDDLETAYAIGDTVLYGSFRPGDRVWARLGANQEITAGALLEGGADGNLVARTSNAAVAKAVEAVTTGANGAGTHIIVEVL